MSDLWQRIGLHDLGVLRIRGADAVRFLQGQLSNDVTRLAPERALLAGLHNPQGRTIALLRLLQWGADDILAIAPREIVALSGARLAKYVLRAKVKIADESDRWLVCGHTGNTAALPAAVNAQWRTDAALWVRLDMHRAMSVASLSGAVPGSDAKPEQPDAVQLTGSAALANWKSLAIAAGEPQVVAATSEEFVAQMLNLDLFDAIAFDKGCYTGQEVIARAHYRGRVKRRMQRFLTRERHDLRPGNSGQLDDGRTFKVVNAVQLPDGRCDFLAVAALLQRDPTAADGETAAAHAVAPLSAEAQPLPYALPD